MCFDTFEELLRDCDLLSPDALLLPEAACRLWSADEKGFESNAGKVKGVRVVAPNACVRATTSVSTANFGHITVCPFLAVGGRCNPPYVVVRGSAALRASARVWPRHLLLQQRPLAKKVSLILIYKYRHSNSNMLYPSMAHATLT